METLEQFLTRCRGEATQVLTITMQISSKRSSDGGRMPSMTAWSMRRLSHSLRRFAAQTHGDTRKAIDLIRVAGELAEREDDSGVRAEHVRAAQQKVEKNRVLEVVRGISTQKKLCLYATAAVAAQTYNGSAWSTTGYRVYQFITETIDADQYHQETYVNKMKELTTYSLVEFKRRSHGPSSGMFLEFQFGERPDTILETLREDSRINMVSADEVRSVVQAQIRNQT